jgi:hypothetical protein
VSVGIWIPAVGAREVVHISCVLPIMVPIMVHLRLRRLGVCVFGVGGGLKNRYLRERPLL